MRFSVEQYHFLTETGLIRVDAELHLARGEEYAVACIYKEPQPITSEFFPGLQLDLSTSFSREQSLRSAAMMLLTVKHAHNLDERRGRQLTAATLGR